MTSKHLEGVTIEEQKKQRWVILGIIYLSFLAFALTFQSIPPILSLVIDELNLTHAQGGLLMSFYALPAIIISIPAGMLADRYSQKLIGAVSLVLLLLGSVMVASGNSLPLLAIGRVIAGIGGAIVLVVAPKMVVQWFSGLEKGGAIGILNTSMPLGAILSLNLLSLLAENIGWRSSIWLTAGLCMVALVVFLLWFAPAPVAKQPISLESESLLRSIRKTGASIWFVACVWMLFTGAHIAFITFSPDLLKSGGLSIASAGFLTSLTMFPSLVLSPAIGYIIDKIDRKRTVIALGGLTLALFVIWTPHAGGWTPVLILLTGASAGIIPSPTFALASEVIGPEKLGLGYGILSTFSNLGIMAGPALAGLLRDVSGSYTASYNLIAGLAFMVVIFIFLSRQRKVKPGLASESGMSA